MLQIRLSKGSSLDSGGGAKSLPVDTVTVACPDHLVLADLPVAKSLGNVSAASLVKAVGRRSRRLLGDRVHFCVRCDFPITIYGRLSPCEHAFCLDCARSDSSCYLCDERIQKIQTIKMMEGIFICAAPHCLKSFLKRSEFESHIHESHASTKHRKRRYTHVKQSIPADSSTARSQQRPVFSPNSNSQPYDSDDKGGRHQPRELPLTKPVIHPKPPPFYARQQSHPSEVQPDNPPQPFDGPGPYGRFHHQQSFDSQTGPYYWRDADQFPDKQQGVMSETSFPEYPHMHSHEPPNFVVPVNANQGMPPHPPYSFPLPPGGTQTFHNPHYEGSLLGFPPGPVGGGFPDSYPRPWSMGPTGVPFEPPAGGQGIPDGFANPADSQGRVAFFQGDYGRFPGWWCFGSQRRQGCFGTTAIATITALPPHLAQMKRGKFSNSGDAGREGQGYGWQNERRVMALEVAKTKKGSHLLESLYHC
ncbi:hypothetical protein NE237_021922 [Protea cynaroides]|uniref:RING-type E3 ubiquitin transferase n=1 Tax=Protea cynaroides TaxID=273540 RepID=A0A9Q0K408_9MAGN|nr:hypothetical protein NE237_021922 [Protea cynaroides]